MSALRRADVDAAADGDGVLVTVRRRGRRNQEGETHPRQPEPGHPGGSPSGDEGTGSAGRPSSTTGSPDTVTITEIEKIVI